jgi:hypothetical protein
MSTDTLTRHPPQRAPRRPRLIGLQARLHAVSLDRELADGVPTWSTPRHAARALQLTSRKRRTAIADGLDRLLADAQRPARNHRLSAGIAPCRASVSDCATQIMDLSDVLRSHAPVSAAGIANLRGLLCDGAGPVYVAHRGGELQRALHRITLTITVPT